ncbi:MAG: redoxin family protein [Flavobacteriaceae bacterium]|nr:thioredoxin family protein [Bacteroidia bacterium]NNF81269.1 redoxin family protein [Flavobacteriaceae bacterium]NNK69251.1 redoxin family protein [Flavobacteriaceae bacterium]
MKKSILLLIVILSLSGCGETPTQFSEEALDSKLISLDGSETDLRSVLTKNKEKVVLIDLWASWCRDCIVAFPDIRAMQEEYSEVEFIFLSYDKSVSAWKNSLNKYQLKGQHYYVPSGWDGPLGDFVRLNWIPRYMVINKDSSIKLFKATKARDQRIKDALL